MRIRKIGQVTPSRGSIVDSYNTSTTDGYSANYINDHSVVVSPTEPTTDRKKVWLRHSKNILKCKQGISSPEANVTVTTDYTGEALNYINVSKSSSTSWNVFIEVSSFIFEYDTGNYILNGCPSGGSTNTYQLYFRDDTSNTDVSPRDEGSGAEVNLTKGHQYTLYIRINASATFTDKKFYPMLRPSTETDDTYEPYVQDKEYILNNNTYEIFVPYNGEVVWNNPSPTSDFSAQNITLSKTYSKVEIIYKRQKSSDVYIPVFVYNSYGSSLPYMSVGMYTNKLILRQAYLDNTTVHFFDGVYYENYGVAPSGTSNDVMIPIKIIGYN